MSIPISKSDFIEWRGHNCFQEFQASALETISDMGGNILNRETSTPERDMYEKGFIKGMEACLNWRPDFSDNDKSDEQYNKEY